MKKFLFGALLLAPLLAMSQVKVNQLPSAIGNANSTDLTICDQAGTTKSCAMSQVLGYMQNNISVQCSSLPALTGVITSTGCTASWASATGTGSVVLANSPTLTTPSLGTPSAVTLTNATGLPLTALPSMAAGTVLSKPAGGSAGTPIASHMFS